jgi:hypothetical protein
MSAIYQKNDEARMTDGEAMTKKQSYLIKIDIVPSHLVICHSFELRHSSFVIPSGKKAPDDY